MEFFKLWLTITIFLSSQITVHTENHNQMKTLEAKGLRTTIYKVDDLQEAKAWYARVFGKDPYFDEPFYVGFDIGGYELGLLPEKVTPPKTTNVLAYWAVDDITDAYDLMASNGAQELEPPKDVGDDIKVALVKDPWDNVIGLIYNPYFQANEPLEKSVVEWAPFQLKPQYREEDLLIVSKKLQHEFLVKQEGFIKRELLKKSARDWVDVIHWKNKELAKKAMKAAGENPACAAYFELMNMEEDPGEGSLQHYDLVSEY